MEFVSPVSTVIPSAHGAVLVVLARAGRPLTGRAIAALTDGRVGPSRTNQVLAQLAQSGLVIKDEQPLGNLYSLNCDHVAAPAVLMLARLREELMTRMSAAVAGWRVRPTAVWLFGSAARGEATSGSDLDVLVVRPDAVPEDDTVWLDQVDEFSRQVTLWSGNDAQVLELSRTEVHDWTDRGEPLMTDLRSDALTIAGQSPASLLRRAKVLA